MHVVQSLHFLGSQAISKRPEFGNQLLGHTLAQLAEPLLVGPQREIPGPLVIRILPGAGDRPSLQDGQAVGTPCPLHVGTPAQLAFHLIDHNEQRFQVRLLQQRFGLLAALAAARPKSNDLTVSSAHQPVVRVHASVDETGAGSGNCFNHGAIVLVRPRITAKSDAGAVLRPHFLDQHGHPARKRIEGQFLAVQQSRIRPQRRPH